MDTPRPFNGQPAPDPIQRLAIKGFGPELSTYQEGAHFEALDEGVLMVPSKSIGYFLAISSCPEVRCTGIRSYALCVREICVKRENRQTFIPVHTMLCFCMHEGRMGI